MSKKSRETRQTLGAVTGSDDPTTFTDVGGDDKTISNQTGAAPEQTTSTLGPEAEAQLK